MKYASITKRLANLGGKKWEIYNLARSLIKDGVDIIDLTIGEPDMQTPTELLKVASDSMFNGRTKYSSDNGEEELLIALSERYTTRSGRYIDTSQFLCLPGTQSALYLVMMCLTEEGDEVLVGDPLYATYEGVIAASGSKAVYVPLSPENGFRISATDIESKITPNTRAILLNTPHNPTGSILTKQDIADIGEVAKKHNIWIISDEVYEEIIYDKETFVSPLSFEAYADKTIVVSSISKSHAAPGFRSGWCVAPKEVIDNMLPTAEIMLFGNQPFIADMTAKAIAKPSECAVEMSARFSKRADIVYHKIHNTNGLTVYRPQAGMFILINIASTGLNGEEFALKLIQDKAVAVMPGTSFGSTLVNWIRLGLTSSDENIEKACDRIIEFTKD